MSESALVRWRHRDDHSVVYLVEELPGEVWTTYRVFEAEPDEDGKVGTRLGTFDKNFWEAVYEREDT